MPETNSFSGYFLVEEKYVLGVPESITSTERTIDILFNDFARNTEMQKKLKLLSSVFAEPYVSYPLSMPLAPEEIRSGVAGFLSAFIGDQEKRKRGREYLMNNGILRILIEDDRLREEVNSIL